MLQAVTPTLESGHLVQTGGGAEGHGDCKGSPAPCGDRLVVGRAVHPPSLQTFAGLVSQDSLTGGKQQRRGRAQISDLWLVGHMEEGGVGTFEF